MNDRTRIRAAHSCAENAQDAVREFHRAVYQDNMALVVFFCSAAYDSDALAEEMNRLFRGVQVVGCTTAGEIGTAGYRDFSLSGISFSSTDFTALSACIENLHALETVRRHPVVDSLHRELDSRLFPQASANSNCVALQLIDGLSLREEAVSRVLQSALGRIPLVGGSAADSLSMKKSRVYSGGRFHDDASVLILLASRVPCTVFRTHHLEPMPERLVVTEADPARRTVLELNGRPAAGELSRVLGQSLEGADLWHMLDRTTIVLINGESYVRTLNAIHPDQSLTFFCAIEKGTVLRIARSADLLPKLERAFADIRAKVGAPQCVLGFDCSHRKLAIMRSPEREKIAALMLENRTTGFCTYGEQYRGLHMNQTFVGVAFGSSNASGEEGQ
jgi:hypothetical protein